MTRHDRIPTLGSLRFASLVYQSAGPRAAGARRRRRVLLAEDDTEMRSMLADELRRDGYDVLQASDGAEVTVLLSALRNTPKEAPEAIIMDVRMPARTGLELLADLRKNDWRVPVILITAFGGREVHEKARQLGAQAVLDKPFDVDDLQTALLRSLPPAPAA